MENEYQILSHLQHSDTTTQRRISSNIGLSLGAVNLLIKKMVRKGLIKVEKLNARTVRYILTPKGLQEKARLTYHYARQSYRRLLKINQALDNLLKTPIEAQKGTNNNFKIDLFGPKDEVFEILSQRLKEHKLAFGAHTSLNTLNQEPVQIAPPKHLIITWRAEEEEVVPPGLNAVNLMKLL